jgi:hypothetical protein
MPTHQIDIRQHDISPKMTCSVTFALSLDESSGPRHEATWKVCPRTGSGNDVIELLTLCAQLNAASLVTWNRAQDGCGSCSS